MCKYDEKCLNQQMINSLNHKGLPKLIFKNHSRNPQHPQDILIHF